MPSDAEGEITCVASGGKSVVDYFLCAKHLCDIVTDMHVVNRCESDHFPIVASLLSSSHADAIDEEGEDVMLEDGTKFIWKDQFSASFLHAIAENEDSEFQNFMLELEKGVEEGSTCLVSFLQRAGSKMRVKAKTQETRAQPPWWDADCQLAKQNKYRQLKVFRWKNTHEDLEKYLDQKKQFKAL